MRDTGRGTSPPHSADWGYTLGQIQSDSGHHNRRITKLEENSEKHKADIDKLKVWAERAAFLVLLYAINAGLYLSAPVVGPMIGALARSITAGLRGG